MVASDAQRQVRLDIVASAEGYFFSCAVQLITSVSGTAAPWVLCGMRKRLPSGVTPKIGVTVETYLSWRIACDLPTTNWPPCVPRTPCRR